MSTPSTDPARELLVGVVRELAPRDAENRLVPRVLDGSAPRSAFGAIAGQEMRIVPSDWRCMLALAGRSDLPAVRGWFAGVAAGEQAALDRLVPLARATGLDPATPPAPLPGCQAYPSFLAWLALNAGPADALVALAANFVAWGRYCAAVARGMRSRYGFDDEAVGFFDLFATGEDPHDGTGDDPDPAAVAAVAAALDAGVLDPDRAREHARLFQDYELLFWNTVSDLG